VVDAASLVALLHQVLGSYHLLGAGGNEQAVEDLVAAAEVPVMMFLMDSLGKDAGASLVQRIQKFYPGTKSVLLVNSLDAYSNHPNLPEMLDGAVKSAR
jgi:hypothetical protein